MTKVGKKTVTNPDQLNLFERLIQEKEERQNQRPGRLCIASQLNAAVCRAIDQYIYNSPGKSRATFCDELSAALGLPTPISVATINNMCSEAHAHRWPAEWLPAICLITGCNEPANIINDTIGVFTLPGPDALRAEIQKIEEDTRKLQKERQKRLLFLQELEAKS